MSSEINVRTSLQIRRGNINYQCQPTSFNADMAGTAGPTPGSFPATTSGTNVDLSKLNTLGGMARFQNLDPTNYVEYGIHDGALFHPLGEILPGESYVLRLSRNLGEEEDMPGTGTTGVVNNLCFRANTATCQVLVEAFDK